MYVHLRIHDLSHIIAYMPQRNNQLVWEQSLKITGDLINMIWKNKDVVEVEHVVDVTLPVIVSRNEFLMTLTKTV